MEASKPKVKPEGVRAWYDRTTRKSRRAFVVATVVSLVIMTFMWLLAPMEVLTRLQTYNGALTVPLIGGLWIFAFIFQFLVPSREASFRGQEALEQGVELLVEAAAVWNRVGVLVEREFPLMVKKMDAAVEDLRVAGKAIETAVAKNSVFMDDARPALDSLKAIEKKIEHEMNAGIVEEFRMAIDAVKMMMPPPPSKVAGASAPKSSEPNLNTALDLIKRNKKPVSGSSPIKV